MGFRGWLALLAFRKRAAQQFNAIPRKISVLAIIAAISILIGSIWLSIGLDRAASVDRAAVLAGEADLRLQIWPITLDMTQHYFPAGIGFGTFDPVFRISEPDGLLSPQYINLAHNDWLQIFLEGGALSLIMLAIAMAWFFLRSFRAWISKHEATGTRVLAKAGSIVVALILAASVTDYPARTPFVMALLALTAIWLVKTSSGKAPARERSGIDPGGLPILRRVPRAGKVPEAPSSKKMHVAAASTRGAPLSGDVRTHRLWTIVLGHESTERL